ncbi:efflux RND transporter permease subunit [Candidatus Coxiella mudrowiae]|uniref:efflux RND transporter permease subunit n=1 Tax=Candidatus Coxiella mudrowiae TaxID=2054173 RepID=UPI002467DF16|nr:efflux RND transporter permease subunit [Candidatus Coxiella mudrowiae]
MMLTLATVYASIEFMTGLTGALFTEFVFALTGYVIVSRIIALTLSPMTCSRLLIPNIEKQRYIQWVDRTLDRVKKFYSQ